MKLTLQHVMDATLTLSQVIREQRPMTQKGKYRLARMHAKLLPEFNTINETRDGMIKAYDTHATNKSVDPATGIVIEIETPEWKVPDDKLAEFNEAWKKIAAEEIEVDVEPIPLAYLDLGGDGSIQANEFIALGDLVKE